MSSAIFNISRHKHASRQKITVICYLQHTTAQTCITAKNKCHPLSSTYHGKHEQPVRRVFSNFHIQPTKHASCQKISVIRDLQHTTGQTSITPKKSVFRYLQHTTAEACITQKIKCPPLSSTYHGRHEQPVRRVFSNSHIQRPKHASRQKISVRSIRRHTIIIITK